MSWDSVALTLTVAGAFFLIACASLEAVLWIDDRLAARRNRKGNQQ
jgi:hypothetical protein